MWNALPDGASRYVRLPRVRGLCHTYCHDNVEGNQQCQQCDPAEDVEYQSVPKAASF